MSSDSDGDEVDAFSAVLRKFLPGGLGDPTEAVTTPTSARAARPFDAAEPATPLGDDAFEGWEELFDEALGGAAAGGGSAAGEGAAPAAEVGA